MATVKTYDSKCLELAQAFLSDEPDLDTPDNRHALAVEIQQCIEDEIFYMRNGAECVSIGEAVMTYDHQEIAQYNAVIAAARIAELTAALEEALEYFEDNYDVVDGEDGPRPNKEMQLGQMIDKALYGIRF